MALKATVYHIDLAVADIDKAIYANCALKLARHPSETDERVMIRVLAYAMFYDSRLAFGGDISNSEEPALWLRDDTGAIQQWIEVGLPEERLLRRAAGRAREVIVLAYGGSAVDVWWKRQRDALARIDRLRVVGLTRADTTALAALAARNLELHITLQEGNIFVVAGTRSVMVSPEILQGEDSSV